MTHRHPRGRLATLAAAVLTASLALAPGTAVAQGPATADELVLGLACVGLAITAGTYATLGATAPARVGLSVAKAARKARLRLRT